MRRNTPGKRPMPITPGELRQLHTCIVFSGRVQFTVSRNRSNQVPDLDYDVIA
jgi:hypothetical protein